MIAAPWKHARSRWMTSSRVPSSSARSVTTTCTSALQLLGGLEVGRLGDDLEVVLLVDQRPQTLAEDALGVDEREAYGLVGLLAQAGILLAARQRGT